MSRARFVVGILRGGLSSLSSLSFSPVIFPSTVIVSTYFASLSFSGPEERLLIFRLGTTAAVSCAVPHSVYIGIAAGSEALRIPARIRCFSSSTVSIYTGFRWAEMISKWASSSSVLRPIASSRDLRADVLNPTQKRSRAWRIACERSSHARSFCPLGNGAS